MFTNSVLAFRHITAGKDLTLCIADIDRDSGVLLNDRSDKINIRVIVRKNELTGSISPYRHVLLLFVL